MFYFRVGALLYYVTILYFGYERFNQSTPLVNQYVVWCGVWDNWFELKRENIAQTPMLLQFLMQSEEGWNMWVSNSGNQTQGSNDPKKS